MIRVFLIFILAIFFSACAEDPSTEKTKSNHTEYLSLGISEEVMLAKMIEHDAQDVTEDTKYEFYSSSHSPQKYYWWKLPDNTIIAVLLTGSELDSITVVEVEVSKPGIGMEGISNWRSSIKSRASSVDRPNKKQLENKPN